MVAKTCGLACTLMPVLSGADAGCCCACEDAGSAAAKHTNRIPSDEYNGVNFRTNLWMGKLLNTGSRRLPSSSDRLPPRRAPNGKKLGYGQTLAVERIRVKNRGIGWKPVSAEISRERELR